MGGVWVDSFSLGTSFVLFIFIFLGAITKRAQFPFSSWLPAAMAAPTPVSSLVHSSTLVTAGVYLMIRFNYLFYPFLSYISFFSLLTIFLGGLMAYFELDFKKIVAISTLRQLGFIIFSISIGFWGLSFLHLLFHSYYKRRLFLATGNLMHYIGGGQDTRNFGSFGASTFSKVFFVTRALRLIGFPFSLGFYSKDALLGMGIIDFSRIFGVVFLLSCVLTVSYRVRVIKMSFIGSPKFIPSLGFMDEIYYFLPLVLLYCFCCFSGNFYFSCFVPVVTYTFTELCIGVLIIAIGTAFFFSARYYLVYFTMRIVFLQFLSMPMVAAHLKSVDQKIDQTWVETIGALGIQHFLDYRSTVFSKYGKFGITLIAWVFFWILLLSV